MYKSGAGKAECAERRIASTQIVVVNSYDSCGRSIGAGGAGSLWRADGGGAGAAPHAAQVPAAIASHSARTSGADVPSHHQPPLQGISPSTQYHHTNTPFSPVNIPGQANSVRICHGFVFLILCIVEIAHFIIDWLVNIETADWQRKQPVLVAKKSHNVCFRFPVAPMHHIIRSSLLTVEQQNTNNNKNDDQSRCWPRSCGLRVGLCMRSSTSRPPSPPPSWSSRSQMRRPESSRYLC
jgi:hypothetical protein